MSRTLALTLLLALAGCGGSSPAPDAASLPDAASSPDATAAVDAPSSDDAFSASTATHDCEEADFLDLRSGPADSRMIMVPRGTFTFDQPCITISAGQAVMFMWDFAAHPLAPGVAPGHPGTGTEPSPIAPQSSGALYEPAFPSAGDYPFYCTSHFHSGMYGVVRVLP